MARLCIYIIGICLALVSTASAQGNADSARDVLRRTADAFRRAGGVEASFSVRSPEGRSEGTIRLKGEKFVLEVGGIVTWFDGHTQWTYLPSSDEVNISEPAPEELQGINPYAWLSLYDHGYSLKQRPSADAGTCEIELTATAPDAPIGKLVVRIEKNSWRPVRISLIGAGSTEATVISVHRYHTGLSWPDSLFTFDRKAYPSAEIIDLR